MSLQSVEKKPRLEEPVVVESGPVQYATEGEKTIFSAISLPKYLFQTLKLWANPNNVVIRW